MARKIGRAPYLTHDGGERVVKWILGKAKLGFPMHPNTVKGSVQKNFNNSKAQTPIPANFPGI